MKSRKLADYEWKLSYSTEYGNPVSEFYEPVLSCAKTYDRITGYFSANTLALVARGMQNFVLRNGKMRLLVSVQLDEDDARAIQKGYELRQKVFEKLDSESFDNLTFWTANSLQVLTRLVAENLLEVKIGVLRKSDGSLNTIQILHDKVGIFRDEYGNELSFIGSNNETGSGWELNSESFEVACSWVGGNDTKRVQEKKDYFNRIWEGKSDRITTLEFPAAILQKILSFHSQEMNLFAQKEPSFLEENQKETPVNDKSEPIPEEKSSHTREEIWSFINQIPRFPEGVTVGVDTSIVKPWGHQLRNFERAIGRDPVRLLIADEVGLGKTISAGLIIRHMILSKRAKRILLLAPGGVLFQWQNELYEKFNLNIPIYNGKELLYRKTHSLPEKTIPVSQKDWNKENFIIASTFLLRRQDRQPEILDAEAWDFLIVDEVHHARRKGAGSQNEGPPNLLLQLLRKIKEREKARSILFLSATPMQVNPVELWDLLQILGLPKEWTEENYSRFYETLSGTLGESELQFLRTLFQDYESHFGSIPNPIWNAKLDSHVKSSITRNKIMSSLRENSKMSLKSLSFSERESLKFALGEFNPIKSLIARNTRSLLKEYYKRGILKHRIPDRIVKDLPLDMPPAEKAFYDEVENYIKDVYNSSMGVSFGNRGNTGFILTIYRRRLASSYYALQQTLTKRLYQLTGKDTQILLSEEDIEDEERAEREEEITPQFAPNAIGQEKERINQLLRLLAKLGTPYKCTRLFEELKKQANEGKKEGIVFTQFTDTLNFLRDKFLEYFPVTVIGCYSGDGAELYENNRRERITKELLKNKFREGKIRYLLCTDAAAEGLNLQFAGLLINYDLPWNPMKVEQRIGRIDRIGQAHEKIHILNFAYKGTVEAEIYFRLADRIQMFQGIIGKLQPILTVLKSELDKVLLTEGEERVELMDKLLSRLEDESKQTNTSKDIDTLSEDHTDFPVLPPSRITMENIRNVLQNESYRPTELGWSPIDKNSFRLNYPGKKEPLRITFDPETFDRDPLNHEFLTYGNWIFDELVQKYGSSIGEEEIRKIYFGGVVG
jgi:SNF2 family DNA or RNA helicase